MIWHLVHLASIIFDQSHISATEDLQYSAILTIGRDSVFVYVWKAACHVHSL